jgi:hypothetical protein
MIRSPAPRLAVWFVAGSIVVLYSHAVFYLPTPYGDQFPEIYSALTRSFGDAITDISIAPLFRPGQVVIQYLSLFIFGPNPFSNNYLQVIFLILVGIGALSLISCHNWIDAGAGITALSFLFGHHAFVSVLEAHITFSNGFVLLLMIVVIHVLQSKGDLSDQFLAIIISIIALLTKEVGLIVPFTLLAGSLLGFSGVRRRTATLLFAFLASYVGFRLYELHGTLGLGESMSERLSNVVAAQVMIVTGEPYDGKWAELLHRHLFPWRIIRISLGLGTVALCLIAFCLRREAAKAFPEKQLVDAKWMLLLLGVTVASAAIAFEYTRHRFGAMALPVAFLLVYRSLRVILWRLSSGDVRAWVRVGLMTLLAVYSLGWSSRVADGFYVVRYMGAKTMVDWIEHYDKYREQEDKVRPQSLSYLNSFFWAAEEKPWPTIQNDRSFIRLWLGDEDVMNR